MIALAVTWPSVVHPASTTFGVTYGDLGSHIGTPAAWVRDGVVPWLPGRVAGLDAPEGLPNQWALNLAAAPSLTLLMGLTALVGPIAANGVLVVSGFTLSAWAMFLLARRLVGRADASFIAGLAFGFWPYMYATASQPLGQGWVLVLLTWRMIVLLERPTARNGLWAGAAAVLAMSWIQYWFLIAGLLWASLAAAGLAVAWRRGVLPRAVRAQAAGVVPVVGLILVLGAAGLATGFQDVPDRPAQDQTLYSARAAMYLVPGPHQPVLGRWTGPFLDRRFGQPGSTAVYNPIYVGVTTIVLAAIGGLIVLRKRRAAGRASLIAVGAAGVVALVMSAPPRMSVLGLSIPMPAAALSEVTTAFRTSARFAHVVMLVLCLFAAVGAAAILRGRRPALAVVAAVVLGAVVFTDLWARDPAIGSPERVVVPPTLRALERQPPGIVATYPIEPAPSARSGPVYTAVFHRHRVFNGYRQATPSETRKLGLSRLLLPWVPGELRAYGVRYVLVEAPADIGGNDELPSPGTTIPGLEVIAEDASATLYRVVAEPATDVVLARSGFSYIDGTGAGAYRFMTSATGTLDLRSDCGDCRRELTLTATAVAEPRRLVVRDGGGRALARIRVPLAATPVRVPVSIRGGRAVVSLTTDPGPGPISPTDFREAGISVGVRMTLGQPPRTPGGSDPGVPPG